MTFWRNNRVHQQGQQPLSMSTMGGGSSADKQQSQKPTVRRLTPEEFEEMQRQAEERYRNRPRPVDANGNIIDDEPGPVCRLPPQPKPVLVAKVVYANEPEQPNEENQAGKPSS